MNIEQITLPAVTLIGMEGSTDDGDGFVARLWEQANARFSEIEPLVMRDENGIPTGFWGAMTDFSRSFRPWENGFTRGLYLAGAECLSSAMPPPGWTKWTVPSFEYLRAECGGPELFPRMLEHIAQSGHSLAGAVHDYTDPKTGKSYMLFPIRRV